MRFLFIDRILEAEKGNRAVMAKNVTNSEDYFSLHFPGFPVMPGALMVECLEQAATLFVSFSTDFKSYPVLKKVENAKFRKMVTPGDQIRIETKLESMADNEALIKGIISNGGNKAATMNLGFTLMPDEAGLNGALSKMQHLFQSLSQDFYQRANFR